MESKMKKWTIIYTFVLSFFCGVAWCMENTGHITDPLAQVFDLFLNNQKERLSHQIIYSLAQVSKSCKKFLLDTAPERREYLLCKAKKMAIKPQELRYLNTYGSLLYDMGKRDDYLHVAGYFLDENKVQVLHDIWDNFSSCVASLPRPFLTPEGDLCCYGWGKDQDLMLWGQQKHLIQYCLLPDGKSEFFRCGVDVALNWNYALSHFAALPHLLKAFVNCPMIHKNAPLQIMFVYLEGAIIPDNYAEYQDCGDTGFNIKFDDLEEALKEAIIARYEECKNQEIEA